MRGRVAALLVALMIVVTGCDQTSRSFVDLPIRRKPAPLISATCPTDPDVLGLGSAPATGPVQGSVPRGFVAETVIRCRLPSAAPTPGPHGEPRHVVVEETAPVSAALLASLALPDQRFPSGGHWACAAVAVLPVYLILVDAHRRAVRPELPQDPCRLPRTEVTTAIAGLRFRTAETYTVTER